MFTTPRRLLSKGHVVHGRSGQRGEYDRECMTSEKGQEGSAARSSSTGERTGHGRSCVGRCTVR